MSGSDHSSHDFSSKLFAAGQKAMDFASKLGELNTATLKTVTDRQLDLGAALVELGGAQFKSLELASDPKAVLQSQKESLEAFRAKVEEFARSVTDVAGQTQKAYAEFAREFASDIGLPLA